MAEKAHTYGVKLVRGPLVRVPPHSLACATLPELHAILPKFVRPRAADLFCGAGGLSLGLQRAGFDVIVGVDHDALALETYAGQFPGLALDRDLADDDALDEVIEILNGLDVSLIAGGPPCQPFSRAGRSKIRSLVEAGARDPYDHRRDMWESFLEVVVGVLPPAVMLENVPELALGDDVRIVRTIVDALERLGYGVHTRLLHALEQGVPQFRQRFVLVALAGGRPFSWPRPTRRIVTVGDAIGDLPPVEGGWRPDGGAAGWIEYSTNSHSSAFARRARAGSRGSLRHRVYDQVTRPVRPDDRRIFEHMDSTTRYTDIDESLRRYRSDIFDDKYKRLGLDEPSRSITAHIARDGYWYIHPTQPRTLTIREAARIQTFPDHVRFAGTPSIAFRQIGNAVPPLLAERVGQTILRHNNGGPGGAPQTMATSRRLADWFLDRDVLDRPWLLSTTWGAAQGELLLHRSPTSVVSTVWHRLEKLDTPEVSLDHGADLREIGAAIGHLKRVQQVLAAARWFVSRDVAIGIGELQLNPHLPDHVKTIAELVAGEVSATPLVCTAPVLRLTARVTGERVDERHRLSQGRLQVARLVGGCDDGVGDDTSRFAMAAVLELAASVCRPTRPACHECPLVTECAAARRRPK